MKSNKLNHCLLGLFAALSLCIGTAEAAKQSGICTFQKHIGGAALNWELQYTSHSATDTINKLDITIGGQKPSFTPDIGYIKTGRGLPGEPVEITYDNFVLLGLTKIIFPNPEVVVLQIPHKDRPNSTVEGKRIVSLKIKDGEDAKSSRQLWRITYLSGTVGRRCYSDLVCHVTGDNVIKAAGDNDDDDVDFDFDEKCEFAD